MPDDEAEVEQDLALQAEAKEYEVDQMFFYETFKVVQGNVDTRNALFLKGRWV